MYWRPIRRSIESLPDWTGRWSDSHTEGQSAIASISRSDRSHGCEVTNRSRGMAGVPSAVRIASTARISSARSGRPSRSWRRPTIRVVRTWAKRRLGRQVVAVAVDILAEQGDLAVACGRQGLRLGHDLVERPAALGSPAIRDDAVGARLVAAVDDRQPGADRQIAANRATGDRVGTSANEVRGVRHPGALDHRRRRRGRGRGQGAHRRLRGGQPQAVHELRLLVGAQEQVDGGVPPGEAVAVRLAHRATGHHDAQPGVGGLEPAQVPLATDDLGLGRLTDGAGVDDHQVGRLHRGRLGAAGGQQPPGHLLRVALVHLAAQRPDEERRQRARLGAELGQALVVGGERVARSRGRDARRHELEDG